jgi:hypothetical protein
MRPCPWPGHTRNVNGCNGDVADRGHDVRVYWTQYILTRCTGCKLQLGDFPGQLINQPRGYTKATPWVSLPTWSRIRNLQILDPAYKPLRCSGDALVSGPTDRPAHANGRGGRPPASTDSGDRGWGRGGGGAGRRRGRERSGRPSNPTPPRVSCTQ